jgi:hypothetical protein
LLAYLALLLAHQKQRRELLEHPSFLLLMRAQQQQTTLQHGALEFRYQRGHRLAVTPPKSAKLELHHKRELIQVKRQMSWKMALLLLVAVESQELGLRVVELLEAAKL